MRRAVYAGSFDPLTNGHVWMIERGAALFDELVVAIGVNPEKKCHLPLSDRFALLQDVLTPYPNARADSFENQFLVRYARSVQAGFIVRGIRSEADYEYERAMRHMNNDFDPGITTVFLMPPREIAEISSSLVKGLVGPAGWEEVVKNYVPAPVFRTILEKFAHDRSK